MRIVRMHGLGLNPSNGALSAGYWNPYAQSFLLGSVSPLTQIPYSGGSVWSNVYDPSLNAEQNAAAAVAAGFIPNAPEPVLMAGKPVYGGDVNSYRNLDQFLNPVATPYQNQTQMAPTDAQNVSAIPAQSWAAQTPAGATPVNSGGTTPATPGATAPATAASSGFDLSSIPWWAWVGVGGLVLYFMSKGAN